MGLYSRNRLTFHSLRSLKKIIECSLGTLLSIVPIHFVSFYSTAFFVQQVAPTWMTSLVLQPVIYSNGNPWIVVRASSSILHSHGVGWLVSPFLCLDFLHVHAGFTSTNFYYGAPMCWMSGTTGPFSFEQGTTMGDAILFLSFISFLYWQRRDGRLFFTECFTVIEFPFKERPVVDCITSFISNTWIDGRRDDGGESYDNVFSGSRQMKLKIKNFNRNTID
jgi:hypothetical protein